ncbi:MAG: 2-C-methyl-D-erythritol 2,4-cyclodiphosphate synthase [Sphaerochaetaceae bacterium]|nr:2-C-methyl-D-erythritol 2,4-cyclodiphosphate synthase [Sphaerochaetaceae bacterium]
MRIGTGFDIHRLVPGRALVLGGIKVPSDKGSLAHSDGDALIHAVIDAILGALALGDIGKLFPDTDPRYKDINSETLLLAVLSSIGSHSIVNVDATVILQAPKLGDLTFDMASNLARILRIDPSNVSVKAKTAEHLLGELGSGDAVAVQASVLID